MKTTNYTIALVSLLCGLLAACQLEPHACDDEHACDADPNFSGEWGPIPQGLRRFVLEIVGDGKVLVNGNSCTMEDGLCHVDVSPGTALTLEGNFRFVLESQNDSRDGTCRMPRACRFIVERNLHMRAEIDERDEGMPESGLDDHRPHGLLPGQPGIIIDEFRGFSRHLRDFRVEEPLGLR